MKKILFVCTGNTCRSPMAQAVFNHKAKEQGICAAAFSRGLCADGAVASENAIKALNGLGISLEDHISKTINKKDIQEADCVIGISARHASSLIGMFPEYREKIFAFPFDISDPFGGSLETYKASLSEISLGIDMIIKELFPND